MRTKLTLLAIGLAAMFAAAPTQAALDEGGGAARTPAVASTAGSFTASTVRSDAVMAWNANAGKAAIAACISPVDNPLHESHLYAMTHVAIHDALNAIEPSFASIRIHGATSNEGRLPRPPLPRPRHDVLVPLLTRIPAPFPPACGAAGVASVEADYAAALERDPGRSRQDPRHRTRKSRRCGDPRPASRGWLGHAADRPSTTHRAPTPASTASHPAPRSRSHRAGQTSRRSCSDDSSQFRPGPPYRGDVEEVHGRLRRDQASRRGRRHHAKRRTAEQTEIALLLGRELPAAVEPNRPDRLRRRTARSVGAGPTVRPAQHGSRRRLRRLLRHQVPLQLLAAGDGDPDRRYRRQPEHQRATRRGRHW